MFNFDINELIYGEKRVNINLKGHTKEEKIEKIKNLFISDKSISEITIIDEDHKEWKLTRTKLLRELCKNSIWNTNKEVNKVALENFLTTLKDYSIASIYKPSFFVDKMTQIGINIDLENDLLFFGNRKVRLRIDYGFKNEKGYCLGFFIWAINELINNIKQPEMDAQFDTSIYFKIELIKKTEIAIKQLLDSCR